MSETWGTAEAASRRKLAREFEQVRTILDKIDFLAQRLDMLVEREENSKRPAIREARPVPFSTEVATMARSGPSPEHLKSTVPIAHTSGIKL